MSQAIAEEAVKELENAVAFLRTVAFDPVPTPKGSPTHAGGGSGAHPMTSPRDDLVLEQIVSFLHSFETRVEDFRSRVDECKSKLLGPLSSPGEAPADLANTISEIDGGDGAAPSRRMWTFGASFVNHVTPDARSDELTPLRRSVSAAYGRRRRSTVLVGMPILSLEPQSEAAPALTIRTTRHTHVMASEVNVKLSLQDCQIPYLQMVDTPDFDACIVDGPAFRLRHNNLPTLTVVAMNIFLRYTFVQSLRIDIPRLITFLNAVDSHHRSVNPHHNALHATNVLQLVHLYLLEKESQKESLSDLQLCAFLTSALVMHLGHLGVHDAFLDATSHPLSMVYPEGPQKSMALSMALALLLQPEHCFLAAYFAPGHHDPDDPQNPSRGTPQTGGPAAREEFVFMTSHLIRLSDETLHQELMAQLSYIRQQNYAGSDHVVFVLAAALRVATAAHAFKSNAVCEEWVSRAAAEGFREGSAQLRWYCQSNGVPVRQGAMVLDSAQILPHLQPPDLTDVRYIDFVLSVLRNYVKPLVDFPRSYFSDTWRNRLAENIDALSSNADASNRRILSRSRELFDYSRFYFSSGRHASALVDMGTPRDFFAVLEPLLRGRAAALNPSVQAPRPKALAAPAVDAGGDAATTNPIRSIAALVAFVRRCVREGGRDATLPARRSDPHAAAVNFSKRWVRELLNAEAQAPGHDFVCVPGGPMPARGFRGLNNSSRRDVKSDRRKRPGHEADATDTGSIAADASMLPDEVTCVAIVRALDALPGETRAQDTHGSALRAIVRDLTQISLDFSM